MGSGLPVAQRYQERLPVKLRWLLEGPLRRLRLPRSAFGLNGHSRRRCRSPCAWFCPYSFPGDRLGSGSGCGRHVVRRRRGCLKDGLAEAASAAGGGGGGGSSGRLRFCRALPAECPPCSAARPIAPGPCSAPRRLGTVERSARPL